jgi:hypothetical protein
MSKKASGSDTPTPRKWTGPAPSPNGIAEGASPDYHDIARLAYSHWEARGRMAGSADEDWFKAEQEIRARRL